MQMTDIRIRFGCENDKNNLLVHDRLLYALRLQ